MTDAQGPGPDVSEVDDRADGQVPWRVFVGIGGFVLASSALYGVVSGEEAGTAMLVGAGVLALWCGIFLFRTSRHRAPGPTGPVAFGDHREPDHYLPEASPWPLGMGFGLALVLNGLLIGTWFLVPGSVVLAVSVAGFAQQSRHRR